MRLTFKRLWGRDGSKTITDMTTLSTRILVAAQHALFETSHEPEKIYVSAHINNTVRKVLTDYPNASVLSEKFTDGWEVYVDLNQTAIQAMEESIEPR